MSKRRFGVTILVTLVLALSLVCSTVPQTSDPVPLIISPGTDGIATVTPAPEYNVSITPPIVVDANTTFTDVVRLECPAGYNDTIGIADLVLNSSQIRELQIFVNYSNQKIILIHYQDGDIIQNNTFTLHPNTEAIMGISIIPTPTVINAGPIDSISYNIVCSYEVTVVDHPVASFTVSPDPPYYAPATLTFNASGSTANGGYIVNYTWNFDDLNITTVDVPIITHVYMDAGTYTVTLNVTDSEGLWNTTSKDITVDRCDVAVISVVPAETQVYPTWVVPLNISVTVLNNGTEPINCTVAAYYVNATAAYEIGTLPVNNLAASSEMNLTFSWTLSDVDWGLYTIKANATLLNVTDTNLANNELVDGTVKVKMPGDVDGNAEVKGYDAALFAAAWWTVYGDPKYNQQCDFDHNGDVKGFDAALFAKYWWQSTDKYPPDP